MRLFGLHKSIYQAARLNGHVSSEKALFRQQQVKLFDKLLFTNVHSLEAAKLLGLSRATLFRWKKSLSEKGIVALEPRSTKPIHLRTAQWREVTVPGVTSFIGPMIYPLKSMS